MPPAATGAAGQDAEGRKQSLGLKARLANSALSGCGHDDVISLFSDFDFALKQHLTPIRNQGNRGTCTAHSVLAGIEAQVGYRFGRKVNLSEQQLYAKAKGSWFPTVMDFGDGLQAYATLTKMATTAFAARTEAAWHYNPSPDRVETALQQPVGGGLYADSCDGYTETCSDTNHQYGQACTTVNGSKVCTRIDPTATGASSAEHYLVAGTGNLWRPTVDLTLDQIQANLAIGVPVAIGIDVERCMQHVSRWGRDNDGNWQSYADKSFLNRSHCTLLDSSHAVLGAHSMLAVGYVTDAEIQQRYATRKPGGHYWWGPDAPPEPDGGGYFIVKNSWGCSSGDGGFVYLSRNYLATILHSAATIGGVDGRYAFLHLEHDTTQPALPSYPVTGEVIVQPVTATLRASGSALVQKVEFWEKTGPFSATRLAVKTGAGPWSHAFPLGFADNGDHSYFARGFDGDGNVVTSAVTMIRVRIPGAPSVSLTVKPAIVDEGGTVQLGAAASSSDGSAIVRVDWLRDGVKIGEDTASPFARSVTFQRGEVGDFSFRARAVNANGFAKLSTTVGVRVTAKTKPAIDAFSATPAILAAAGTSTLAWTTTGAEQLLLNPGNIDVTGTTSRNVTVAASTLFTLTAVNAAGSVMRSTSVRVIPPPTIQSFSATPSTTPAGGGAVTLAWSATDALSASIDNGVGSVTGLTSKVIDVSTSTTFTLTVSNPNGTATKQVTVTVPSTPPAKPSISAFAATPSTLASPGGSTTLSWTVAGATSLSIDNGVGSVTGLAGKAVNVAATTTFTLTATNSAGSSTAQVTVTVSPPPPAPPTITSFTAAPASLPAGGGSSTLAWTTSGATSLAIDSGVGNVTGLASKAVNVAATTTYTLTATNGAGSTTASVTVTVAAPSLDRWVDAAAGSDANAGSEAAPWRTLGFAVANTPAGGTLWLKDGSWSRTNEGFGLNDRLAVPAGAALKAVNVGGAVVGFGLAMAGSGTIHGVAFDDPDAQDTAVAATAGTVTLTRIKVSHAGRCGSAALTASSAALMVLDDGGVAGHEWAGVGVKGFAAVGSGGELRIVGGRISGADRLGCTGNGVLWASGTGVLKVTGVTIANSDFSADASAETHAVVVAGGSSVTTLTGTTIDGAVVAANSNMSGVFAQQSAAVTLLNSTITNLPGSSDAIFTSGTPSVTVGSGSTLSANYRGVNSSGGAITLNGATVSANRHTGVELINGGTLAITGSTITGNWPVAGGGIPTPRASAIAAWGGPDYTVTLRSSVVMANGNAGAASPAIALQGGAASSFDIGSAGGVGSTIAGNANAGVEVAVDASVTVRASGNAWNASTQGADANGTYQLGSAPCGATGPCVVSSGNGGNYKIVAGNLKLVD